MGVERPVVTDIVERLRDRSYHWCAGIDPMPGDCQECDERAEAADEIERLRAELDNARAHNEVILGVVDALTANMTRGLR